MLKERFFIVHWFVLEKNLEMFVFNFLYMQKTINNFFFYSSTNLRNVRI